MTLLSRRQFANYTVWEEPLEYAPPGPVLKAPVGRLGRSCFRKGDSFENLLTLAGDCESGNLTGRHCMQSAQLERMRKGPLYAPSVLVALEVRVRPVAIPAQIRRIHSVILIIAFTSVAGCDRQVLAV